MYKIFHIKLCTSLPYTQYKNSTLVGEHLFYQNCRLSVCVHVCNLVKEVVAVKHTTGDASGVILQALSPVVIPAEGMSNLIKF
jgi:hypothetical protein